MTRIRMRKSTLECGIVPQHQITLTLTPSVFPGQKAGSTTTSKPTTAQRQKRAEYATFEPLFKQKSCSAGVQQHPPKKPLLNARLPTMSRSNDPFRRRAIQYACPNKALLVSRRPIGSPNFVGTASNMPAQQARSTNHVYNRKAAPQTWSGFL